MLSFIFVFELSYINQASTRLALDVIYNMIFTCSLCFFFHLWVLRSLADLPIIRRCFLLNLPSRIPTFIHRSSIVIFVSSSHPPPSNSILFWFFFLHAIGGASLIAIFQHRHFAILCSTLYLYWFILFLGLLYSLLVILVLHLPLRPHPDVSRERGGDPGTLFHYIV